MTSSATIDFYIGSAIPPGNAAETAKTINLWQSVSDVLQHIEFSAPETDYHAGAQFSIGCDFSQLVERLEQAHKQSGSFDHYLKQHIENHTLKTDATLRMTLSHPDDKLSDAEFYRVATVYLQQLVLAANLAQPGSIQFLHTRFAESVAHRYEAQEFDSRILYGAAKAAHYNAWPSIKPLDFAQVWNWLEMCGSSQVTTAISRINKTLFSLLKVAQQRHESSARTALMVVYQLEQLLDCRQADSLDRIRSRMRLILGDIPEPANNLNELARIRSDLFVASQPVHRPPLISHDSSEALRSQMDQHNSAVESGTAMVLALLHDLIKNSAQQYEFAESFQRQ
ncbi:hypothetical protein [Pseudohongiella spirulinae]|uniref:Uncharacterized protein n=1 Tax=Pseudohongiella spirulinae TaxID=1249552 RepID=A0A0S2KCZ9_9GAMM|nr:hypothetical protein [Pseudohongiella spirulinae]ALO46198.1 hypothetical protein PS2015_1542 [Pseudohongiella spirulinae]